MFKINIIKKAEIPLLLTMMSCFCFTLTIVRVYISSTPIYLFLNWNLFLSFIPWFISHILANKNGLKNKFSKLFMFMVWLLFFPNSMYILTDLFHLRLTSNFPIWFDFVLITSFAWTGFIFGLISLLNIEKFLKVFFARNTVNIILALFLFIGSYGVYIGRYLRWNSWDIIVQPISLICNIKNELTDPWAHKGTWGMTLLMGVLLNMMFWSVKLLQNKTLVTDRIKELSNE